MSLIPPLLLPPCLVEPPLHVMARVGSPTIPLNGHLLSLQHFSCPWHTFPLFRAQGVWYGGGGGGGGTIRVR